MFKHLLPLLAALSLANAAEAITVNFTNPVEIADGYTDYFNEDVYKTTTLHLTNVATDQGTTVDMRVTTTIKTDTRFAEDYGYRQWYRNYSDDLGYIPSYTSGDGAEPNDDLAFQYIGDNVNSTENGITMTFDFFDGSGDLGGTFTNALTVSELEWAIYDVDGEISQSEFFRAFKSDGLHSFRVGNSEQAVSASDNGGDEILFTGPGANYAEDDASGAAILKYLNTSSFTLDFGSVQSSGSSANFVFSGIDGDLSMFDLNDFTDPFMITTSVPLPAGMVLLLSGLGGVAALRRRRT